MALKRMVLEIGMGNDLHGGDYTKAAVRAVEDAIHHSSLTMLRSLDISPDDMHVEVTIGVQNPGAVDTAIVEQTLPYGQKSMRSMPMYLAITSRPAPLFRATPCTMVIKLRSML